MSIFFVSFALALAAAPPDDDEATRARLRQLEQTVNELSRRVKALEAGRAPTAPTPAPGPAVQEKAYKIPVDGSAVLGPKKARYTVVVFGDLQCPFTRRAYPFLVDLVEDPQLKGRINLVFKHFPLPFHKQAEGAARMALGVQKVGGDKAAFEFMDYLTNHEQGLEDDYMLASVDALKLPRQPVLDAAAAATQIGKDKSLGEQVNVRGTPTIFVSGWVLTDRSVEGVKALIADKKL